jgi:hypothetical protein
MMRGLERSENMRSAWQEFTIKELKSLRGALDDASSGGRLDLVGEELFDELSNVIDARIAASLVRNTTTDTPEYQR